MNIFKLGFARTLAITISAVLLCLAAAVAYTWFNLSSIAALNADAA
jgi:hypothetical protein